MGRPALAAAEAEAGAAAEAEAAGSGAVKEESHIANIEVVVADSTTNSREALLSLIRTAPDFHVRGDARDGQEALDHVRTLQPDILIIDRNITGQSVFSVAEAVSVEYPNTGVVVVFPEFDPKDLKELVRCIGGYLVKPVSRDDLTSEVRKVHDMVQKTKHARASATGEGVSKGQIVTLYSASGGSGKSILACNLAVALAQHSAQKVVLVDLNLQFGDIELMLNLMPESPGQTIAGLAQKQAAGDLDSEIVEHYLTTHDSGLRVLIAPVSPDLAETVTLYTVSQTLDALQQNYQYIVVDVPSIWQDSTFATFDVSTRILVITTLDLLALHKTKTAMDRLRQLYPAEKIKLVLNRSNSQVGITHDQVRDFLNTQISAYIPSDGLVAVRSVNDGKPFVVSEPNSAIAQSVVTLAYDVMGREAPAHIGANGRQQRSGFIARLLGMEQSRK